MLESVGGSCAAGIILNLGSKKSKNNDSRCQKVAAKSLHSSDIGYPGEGLLTADYDM